MTLVRPEKLVIGKLSLPLPIFFPSVSSIKTSLQLEEYLRILSSLAALNNQFLLSAFDLEHVKNKQPIKEILASARQAGIVTLMDSGNYESFWKDAQTEWKQASFHKILGEFSCDMAFSFDEQKPPINAGKHVALIKKRWNIDQAIAGNCQVIPIVHAPASELPVLCNTVAAETGVTVLAVPERRLGNGVLERARTVQAIRSALNDLGRYIVLHLLGTGNPISIIIYTAMGADSFDGLEWCQTVIDYDTGLLHHFSHADFFTRQTAWGDTGLSFQARTLAHNLEYFSDWMQRLRNAVNQNELSKFSYLNLSNRVFNSCADIVGWNR